MNKKNILFIDPPMQRFMNFSKALVPLGLLYVAAEAKKQGHNVKVWDADYNPHGLALPFVEKANHYQEYINSLTNNHPIWEEAVQVFDHFRPDVIGITAISSKLASGLKLAEMYKTINPHVKVIFGGPHATTHAEEIIKNPYVDTVVRREGERAFFAALESNGIITGERIRDLDSLAWPAIETLHGLIGYLPRDLGVIMTSRGCPNSCSFCNSSSLWAGGVTYRSLEDVVEEAEHLNKDYGVSKVYVIDDTFTCINNRAREFARLMSRNNLQWSCLTRVDRTTEPLISSMKDSGCTLVKVGIESGSDEVLKLMNKKITAQQIRNAAEIFQKTSMPWIAYVMVGYPGANDIGQTKKLIEETNPTYVSPSHFTPYPGTAIFSQLGLDGKMDGKFHLFNHHSLTTAIPGTSSEQECLEFFKWADEWNKKRKDS